MRDAGCGMGVRDGEWGMRDGGMEGCGLGGAGGGVYEGTTNTVSASVGTKRHVNGVSTDA